MPDGFNWVQILSQGSHWVTVSCLRPRKTHGVEVVRTKDQVITLFDEAKLVQSLISVTFSDEYQVLRHQVENRFSWPLFSDTPLWLTEIGAAETGRIPPGELVREVLVSERGQVFLPHDVVEDAVCFTPGGNNYLLMGLGRGTLTPAAAIHTRCADYILLPPCEGVKFLFPKAGDVEMMCSSLSLFSKDWLALSSQIGGAENNGALVSTETFAQTFQSCFVNREVECESDNGLTPYQVSRRVGCSVLFAARYLMTQPGYCAWKNEAGKTQFQMDSNIKMQVEGQRNDVSWDGRPWVEVLRGFGLKKEKMRFVSRELQGLLRFLRLNYCLVVKREIAGFVELAIRRP